MSLKKRMFRSNMTILFSALLALMVILLAVLVLFEDTLEKTAGRVGKYPGGKSCGAGGTDAGDGVR